MQRHAATLAAGLAVSAFAPSLYAQTESIAVVDLRRAVAETEDGRRALEKLERWTKRRQRELDAEASQVKALEKTYRERERRWSPEQRAEKAAELQSAATELRAKFVELQRQLAQRHTAATQPILERMQRILQQLGRADGYSLIVDRNEAAVLWVPGNRDLTDLLVQRYNAERQRPAERRAAREQTERESTSRESRWAASRPEPGPRRRRSSPAVEAADPDAPGG